MSRRVPIGRWVGVVLILVWTLIPIYWAVKTSVQTEADARARVDTILKQIDDAKVATQAAADKTRKAAATTALVGSISLLIGAFISSAAAAFGGRQRDEEEDILLTGRGPLV